MLWTSEKEWESLAKLAYNAGGRNRVADPEIGCIASRTIRPNLISTNGFASYWRRATKEEIMDTQTLIATLEAAPGIIIGLVREVPPQNLKRRPAPNKWSAHEHACHISTGQATFLSRLELMLSDPLPQIKSMEPSPDEEAGSLLSVDLDEALGRYVRERALVVKRLKELSADDWQRTAEHEAFSHYSVYIMFRHLLMHEMLHAYRIDELMLKKDWE